MQKSKLRKDGQGDAGVTTPEMISAGVLAFEKWSGSADEYFLVEQVYIAMVRYAQPLIASSHPRLRSQEHEKLRVFQKSS